MVQPGMRITVSGAARARDVSRPAGDPDGAAPGATATPSAPAAGPEPASRPGAPGTGTAKPRKGERRRLGKRGAARKSSPQNAQPL